MKRHLSKPETARRNARFRQKNRAQGLCACGRARPREGLLTCEICLTANETSLLKRRIGIPWDTYQHHLIQQQGRCAICKDLFEKRPCADHNHGTSAFRGLLCTTCNTGLGMFRDSIERLQSAIVYLGRDVQSNELSLSPRIQG